MKIFIRHLSLYVLLLLSQLAFAQKKNVSGFIKEEKSLESLIGASIYLPSAKTGTLSNNYGFFSLTVTREDSIDIRVSMLGYEEKNLRIPSSTDSPVIIFLSPVSNQLREVVVKASEQEIHYRRTPVSSIHIPVRQIKDLPSLMGEKDLLKAIQLLPGVQAGIEGSNGLFVRGGSSDQNLILMDEAKVYNTSHLFGFFSIFNGDALKSMEFIKGAFPARYGGRTSSVLDVRMKEGSKEKPGGEASVGLISSRLTFESPIRKGKSSFIVSARRSYPDLLLSLVKTSSGGKIRTHFYDLNAKFNAELGKKDHLYLSIYTGKDSFFERYGKKGDDYRNSGFGWGNQTATLRWNHLFSSRLFANLSIISSNFRYSLENSFGKSRHVYESRMTDIGIKYDVDFSPSSQHMLRFGTTISSQRFIPSGYTAIEDDSEVETKIETIRAPEGAVYFEDTYSASDRIMVNLGLRYAFFLPNYKAYHFVEPRVSASYNIDNNWTLKAGYAEMNQAVQLLTNNGLGLSADVWVPSTSRIPPQSSRQLTLGITRILPSKDWSIEIEMYVKEMRNILSFRDGASLLSLVGLFRDRDFSSPRLMWEDLTTSGKGHSKGAELLIRKTHGNLTGWVSYTLSKTEYEFDALNNGRPFFPSHDRRHNAAIVASYKLNKRISLASNLVGSTGSPVTLPQRSYESFITDPFTNTLKSNDNVIDYGENSNTFRNPFYARLDMNVQFRKEKKRGLRTWELGFYNITGQRNVFAYETDINGRFTTDREFIRTRKLNAISLLVFIPSISYGFKF